MSDDEASSPSKGEVSEMAKQREQRRLEMEEKIREMKAEYEAERAAEKEAERAEIEAMKERIAEKKRARAAEEIRIQEELKAEAERIKQRDAERKIAAEEEKKRAKAEKERKKREAKEKKKARGKRTFKVVKKEKKEEVKDSTGIAGVLAGAEDMQKTREQLEEEKEEALGQRVPTFEIENMDLNELIEKTKELYDHLMKTESEKYDIDQHYKQRQYDVMELSERARQMASGKKGGIARNEDFDREHDKHQQAPAPIRLASKHERNQEHKSMSERLNLFAVPESEDEDEEGEAPVNEE